MEVRTCFVGSTMYVSRAVPGRGQRKYVSSQSFMLLRQDCAVISSSFIRCSCEIEIYASEAKFFHQPWPISHRANILQIHTYMSTLPEPFWLCSRMSNRIDCEYCTSRSTALRACFSHHALVDFTFLSLFHNTYAIFIVNNLLSPSHEGLWRCSDSFVSDDNCLFVKGALCLLSLFRPILQLFWWMAVAVNLLV